MTIRIDLEQSVAVGVLVAMLIVNRQNPSITQSWTQIAKRLQGLMMVALSTLGTFASMIEPIEFRVSITLTCLCALGYLLINRLQHKGSSWAGARVKTITHFVVYSSAIFLTILLVFIPIIWGLITLLAGFSHLIIVRAENIEIARTLKNMQNRLASLEANRRSINIIPLKTTSEPRDNWRQAS